MWQVLASQRLKRAVRSLLMVGNTVNTGTAYGNADSIRIDSLLKAADLRVCALAGPF